MVEEPDPDDRGSSADPASAAIERATRAIERGDLVVYPTETVYGLGANALDPETVEGVFAAKGRARSEPISLGAHSIDAAFEHAEPTARERAFAREFLPGPVTLVLEASPAIPEILTAGRERVGIRVPDHPMAQALLERTGPLTATSANRSGQPSVRHVGALDAALRERVSVVLDAGETPGTESTVVDLQTGIHRRGTRADEIETWLTDHE